MPRQTSPFRKKRQSRTVPVKGSGGTATGRSFRFAPSTSSAPKARPQRQTPSRRAAEPSRGSRPKARPTPNRPAPRPKLSSGPSTRQSNKPSPQRRVPGRAIVRAIQNTFSGRGSTNAGTIAGQRKKRNR